MTYEEICKRAYKEMLILELEKPILIDLAKHSIDNKGTYITEPIIYTNQECN